MPKKRLNELLQEEAQKFTPSAYENAIEVTAEKVLETAETEISISEETTTKRTNTTKSDLEITIKNLQESLERYQNQEKALTQEITELKTALSEQKSLTEKVGKELYETKKTALKLAESNSQLIEENNELKKQAVKEPVKETLKKPTQEISKSLAVNPRKSYKLPEIVVEKTKTDTKKDDFGNNTWLYD